MIPMHHPRDRSITQLCALLAVGLTASAGEITLVDGIPHVLSPENPARGMETWVLEEVWRAGGEDDEIIFGLITSVRSDRQGNVYLLDAQLCHVYVYSPDGSLQETLYREGEGPGEIHRPIDMVLLDDGRIGAAQEFPGAIVLLDATGTPAGTINMAGPDPSERAMVSLTSCNAGGGVLVAAGTAMGRGETPGVQPRTNLLASYADDGRELVRYQELKTHYNFNDFMFREREHVPHFWWGYDVDRQGRVYTTINRDKYAIGVYGREGTLECVIMRDAQPWRRTPAEKARMTRLIEGATATVPVPVRIEIEDYEPVISYFHRGVRVAADGTLWVLPSSGLRDQPDGVMATYDVFDAEGRFDRQVAVSCPGDPKTDGLFLFDNGTALVVKGYLDALAAQFGKAAAYEDDEEGPGLMEVIYYRVKGR